MAAVQILAFDTATPATSVALALADGTILTQRHEPATGERPGHATQLLPLAMALLDEAGVDWAELDRIAVGVGPGTFTGVRIGVATARALAHAHAIPLVGSSSLRALALAAEADGPQAATVLAVIDARRGEAFAAAWAPGAGADPAADPLLEAAALTPAALVEAVQALAARSQTILGVGDGAIKFRQQLELGGVVVPPDGSLHHRVDAAAHCRLAARMEAGPRDAVLPTYLRLPDAELALRQRRAEQP